MNAQVSSVEPADEAFWDRVKVENTDGYLLMTLDRFTPDSLSGGVGKVVISINEFFREGFKFPFYIIDSNGRPTETDTSENYVCYDEDNLFFNCISFNIESSATDKNGREVFRFQIIDSGGHRARFWVQQYTPKGFYRRNPELLKKKNVATKNDSLETRKTEGSL